jgi:UDP-glucose 4-epimerase
MRVAVFGAGGFIGRRLCRRLVAHGHAVKGFDRPGNAGRIVEGTLFVPGDFTTGEGVSQALEDCEAAVHLIWASVPATAFLATEFEVNVMPSLRLVEEATRRRIPVVFASSGGTVYGRARDLPIDEASPTEPINAYGAGKLAVETLMRVCAAQSGLDSRILRIANGFGRGVPYAGPQGAPDVFLTRALSG